jgi:hypothetical protein
MKTGANTIPTFISGHPVLLSSSLLSKGFTPILYTDKKQLELRPKKPVFIVLSLSELRKFTATAQARNKLVVRIVAFSTPREYKAFWKYHLMLDVYNKLDMQNFTPYFVNLEYIVNLEFNNQALLQNPTKENLEKSINMLRTLL